MTLATRVDPCPLCGARRAAPVLAVAYAQIWAGLLDELSATFTEQVRERHEVAAEARLYRCARCGLEYFSPLAPGDAEFYRQLTAAIGYEPTRWEFTVVRRLLPPGADIVDLGCGSGAFLRAVAGQTGRAVGVDHNPDAIDELRGAGFEGYGGDFDGFAHANQAAFDVVCSFHTLEHLADTSMLMESARACSRPGGRVFVSVPNRARVVPGVLEPLDFPPHHVSRWDAAQFETLAHRFDLELEAVRYEQPDLSHARLAHRKRVEAVLHGVVGPGPGGSIARAWAKLAAGPRRQARAGLRESYSRRGWFGHSMLAEFRVP